MVKGYLDQQPHQEDSDEITRTEIEIVSLVCLFDPRRTKLNFGCVDSNDLRFPAEIRGEEG